MTEQRSVREVPVADRGSTKEAERIADSLRPYVTRMTDGAILAEAALYLRSLAAERDALREENGRLRGRGIGKIADEAFAQGFKRGYAAALGEDQP